MILLLGKIAIYAGLLLAVIAAGIAFYSARDDKRKELAANAYWLTVVVFGAVTVASGILLAGLILKIYTWAYVAEYSSPDMSVFFRIAAFWAGQQGSLLLWAWMLTGMSAIVAFSKVKDGDRIVTYALSVLNAVAAFFFVVLVTPAGSPFEPVAAGQGVAQGINPLLLHWAMIAHPPTLFLGYAGLTIPFAFGIATLLAGDSSRRWLKLAGRWSVLAWLFLSIGIFLGALWAYVVLGWGGFWGWDPVENSSFIPWITGTAMLHSFTMWRRRGTFKVWSIALASATFFLTLLATFITRSGIVQSAHTFPGDVVFKWLFAGFMAIVAVGTVGLLIWRRKDLHSPAFGARGEGAPAESLFSREFVYYLNNTVLCLVAAVITVATLMPALSRAFTGNEVSLSADWYNSLAAPISAAYLVLLAICPLIAFRRQDPAKFFKSLIWPAVPTVVLAVPIVMAFGSRWLGALGMIIAVFAGSVVVSVFVRGSLQKAKAKGANPLSALGDLFARNRTQTGGFVVHFGIALTLIGVIGAMMFATTDNVAIGKRPGDKTVASGLAMTVVSYKQIHNPQLADAPQTYVLDRQDLTLKLSDPKTGAPQGTISPSNIGYQQNVMNARANNESGGGLTPKVDIKAEPLRDVYVILQGQTDTGLLSLQVKINPLVSFVWIGSIILVLGTAWASWPTRRESAAA